MEQVHIYDLIKDNEITGGELLLSSDTDRKTKPILVADLKAYTIKEVVYQLEGLKDKVNELDILVDSLASKVNALPQADNRSWFKKLFNIK